jgi:hypothetical protein
MFTTDMRGTTSFPTTMLVVKEATAELRFAVISPPGGQNATHFVSARRNRETSALNTKFHKGVCMCMRTVFCRVLAMDSCKHACVHAWHGISESVCVLVFSVCVTWHVGCMQMPSSPTPRAYVRVHVRMRVHACVCARARVRAGSGQDGVPLLCVWVCVCV